MSYCASLLGRAAVTPVAGVMAHKLAAKPVFVICWLFGIAVLSVEISQFLGCSNSFDHAKTFEALI